MPERIFSITWGSTGEKPGFSQKPDFFPRIIEMIRQNIPPLPVKGIISMFRMFRGNENENAPETGA
jgi:hypothetical protein